MAKVLITGAAGGLGRALQDAFQARGHTVVATDHSDAQHVLDVRDADACRRLAMEFQPDVWINNAGVLGSGSAPTQPDEEIRRVIEVNLLGCINGTRAALEVMSQRGTGHIINVGSLGSWVPVPGEAVYGATKAGVLSYSLALIGELAATGQRGIRVSVVCPDGMLTPMLRKTIADPHTAMSYSAPQLADPDEVAHQVVDLLAKPRLVISIPRWRGALVRAMAGIPDRLLFLAPVFESLGRRQQRKVQQQLLSEKVIDS